MKENTELHQFELKRTIQLLQYELDGYTDPCKYCGKSGECNDRIPPTPFTRKSTIFDVRNSFWGYIVLCPIIFFMIKTIKFKSMKKVLFVCALCLMGVFAFAQNYTMVPVQPQSGSLVIDGIQQLNIKFCVL